MEQLTAWQRSRGFGPGPAPRPADLGRREYQFHRIGAAVFCCEETGWVHVCDEGCRCAAPGFGLLGAGGRQLGAWPRTAACLAPCCQPPPLARLRPPSSPRQAAAPAPAATTHAAGSASSTRPARCSCAPSAAAPATI
jgi:hypothetical protein